MGQPDGDGVDSGECRVLRADRGEKAMLRRLVEAGIRIVQLGCGDGEGEVGGAAPMFQCTR